MLRRIEFERTGEHLNGYSVELGRRGRGESAGDAPQADLVEGLERRQVRGEGSSSLRANLVGPVGSEPPSTVLLETFEAYMPGMERSETAASSSVASGRRQHCHFAAEDLACLRFTCEISAPFREQ
jgi:hypothetical protein